MGADIAKFIATWKDTSASEQQNKDRFLIELCEVLDVPRPDPATGDPSRDRYVFEYPVREVDADGRVHSKRIDLYREGHFLLEAKQGADKGAKKAGTAKRGTNAWHIAMNSAYGQALGYARVVPKPVPMLVVCDIGHCFDLYESFDGSGAYRHFPTAQTNRIPFKDLEKHVDTLRRVFTDPLSLDPSRRAARVTREVATHLAELARNLESKGCTQEEVARFLMRCLFTMFAEDIQLLPDHLFTKLLHDHWIPSPRSFPGGVSSLWSTMNTGGDIPTAHVRHFNGGLFGDTTALPLDEEALRLLHKAATHDWSDVEPAIFGTLLERALDKKERHRLGAHYTPRAYVERLVRPTIEEPIRAEWDVVRAEVARLRVEEEKVKSEATKKKKRAEAIKHVRAFHERLCKIRVLDPACGSGNFLYVALHLFQQIESEAWALLASLEGKSQDVLVMEGVRVTPGQFLGIEKKRWAKEIAELVLWIGYLQWHYRAAGKKPPVFDPVLRDYKNIENRDAILAFDDEVLVTDEKGKPVTRWDGETMKIHPVTKKEVPDETARIPVYRYLNAQKASWPKVEFVVGNPPFVGNKRMRAALGDGYVNALRASWPDVPETSDYVMYWWGKAAELVSGDAVRRAGLITTNSITQTFSRRLVEQYLSSQRPLSLVYAIPDHPWVDSTDGAAVRISMTVLSKANVPGTLAHVTSEQTRADGEVQVELSTVSGTISPALSVGPNITGVYPLRANAGMSFMGVTLIGEGFRVSRSDFGRLGVNALEPKSVLRRYVMGRDLAQQPEERFVVDFFGKDESAARTDWPALYQWVLERVRPEREQNPRKLYRERWWVFGEPREGYRRATHGLSRYVVTARTSRHRVFQFVDGEVLVDSNVIAVASDDPFVLGILSSRLHVGWSLFSGATLEDRPHYTSSTVFEPYPFPAATPELRRRIASLAADLDRHRKERQAAHETLTITGMYNVLEKLRSGEPLTDKETAIHEKGLISVLKKLHDDLDAAVFEAYGWPSDLTDEQILEKLVALNAERAAEEKQGTIRWLRPDFQNPTEKPAAVQSSLVDTATSDEPTEPQTATTGAAAWPKKMLDKLSAVREVLSTNKGLWTTAEVTARFADAKPEDVGEVLESLASFGHVLAFDEGDEPRWKSVG